MTIGSLACMGIRPCVHSVLFVPDENDTSYFQIVGKEFTLNFRFMISGSEQQIVPLREKKKHCDIAGIRCEMDVLGFEP